MAAFRWIPSLFFLIMILQFMATGQETSFFTVQAGERVSLPCVNEIQTQSNCTRITWSFLHPGNTDVTLFEDGRFIKEAEIKRLRVVASCFLLVNEITAKDAGDYICRDNMHGKPLSVNRVQVITVSEQKDNNEVFFNCSVSKSTYCRHNVRWLYDGAKEDISETETSPDSCSSGVRFPASRLQQDSKLYDSLNCKVTEQDTAKEYWIRPQGRGNDATTQSTTTKRMTTTSTTTTSAMSSSLAMIDTWATSDQSLWYVAVPVVLAASTVGVVAIIRWRKAKGNRGQIEERMAHDENGISYASIGFIKTNKNKSRAADTVTYSTVRAAPSAAAVSIDPNSVYSTIN